MSKESRRAEKANRRKRRAEAARRRAGRPGRSITVSVESDGYATKSTFEGSPGAFHDAPTDEPGTLFGCPECGASLYVEGILPMSLDVKDPASSRVQLLSGCPDCGRTMEADRITVDTGSRVFVATHNLPVELFLKVLLDDLQAGKVTADEAVEKITKEAPALHPLVEWIERRGATLSLVMGVLAIVIAYIGQQGNEPLTPEDVTRIVRAVEHEDHADLSLEDVAKIVEAIQDERDARGVQSGEDEGPLPGQTR